MLFRSLPKVSRIAILSNVRAEADQKGISRIVEAGKKMGVRLQVVRGVTPQEIARAFDAMKREQAGAVIAVADASIVRERKLVADLALKHRLPSFFANRENVVAGGLLSYGENIIESFTRAAQYVSKIMKGAKPGDLPIEQPTKFDLVINRKTAKAIGVALPKELLLRAEEVLD